MTMMQTRTHWGLFVAGAVAALAASPGDAQQATSSSQLAEIVVTAEKRSENIQTVPLTVQAFTAKDLQNLGLKWSSDLGQVTPNMEILLPNGVGNQPIIVIRGIGLNDANSNNAGPNGVYLDQVYLSSPASQTLQMFDLERVEVLKGPQGTLYGQNTTGGAVNLITAQPTDTLEGNLDLDYSSFETSRVEGALGGPLGGGLLGRVAFVTNHSQGYGYNALTGQKENGADNSAARLSLAYDGIDKLKLTAQADFAHVDNRPTEYRNYGTLVPGTQGSANPTVCSIAATYAGQCVDIFGYGTPANFYSGSYNRHAHLKLTSEMGYVRADYTPGEITYTSLTSFEHLQRVHPEDSDQSPYRILEITWGAENSTFSQEFRASRTARNYNWVGGVYFMRENLNQLQTLQFLLDFDQFGGFGIPAGPGAGDGTAFQFFDKAHQVTNAYAAYGQAEFDLTQRLHAILGARYTVDERSFAYNGTQENQLGGENNFGPLMTIVDSNQSLRNSDPTWRVGLKYDVLKDVMAYASIATGFKTADFNGGFIQGTPDQVARLLVPAAPEHVTTYELGVKSTLLDHRLLVDLAGFYNDYRDLQIYSLVPSQAGPLNVLDNAKKAHTEGIDAEMKAKLFTGMTASLQIGLLSTRLDQFVSNRDPSQPNYAGNELPYAPHVSGTLTLDYTRPVGASVLDLQYTASYKSHQYYDSSNDPYIAQDAYWLENARIGWTFPDSRWQVAVYGRNLGNTHYSVGNFDGTVPFGFVQYIVGYPRTFGGEVQYRY
jgi:iron complex outermembrane recepter protein